MDHRDGGGGRGFLAVLIIAFCLFMAVVANNTLGDPSAPADEVKPMNWDIFPNLSGQFDTNQADARVQLAQMTANAVYRNRAAATESARVYQSARAYEATALAQGTQMAYMIQIAEWTKEADAAKSTSEAQVQATASAIAATATIRAYDLEYAKQAEVATATAAAFQYEQEKRALELQQTALMNSAWAVTKWVIVLAAAALAGFLAFRFGVKRADFLTFKTAPNGDVTPALYKNTMLDPDLLVSSITSVNNPESIPLEDRLHLKAADMQINAARALPRIMPNPITAQETFQIIESGATPPSHLLPNPEVMGAVDGEWEAAKNV